MAQSRAERDRAKYGVSSGTYYEMRRKAVAAGISGKTFDKVARSSGGYTAAKTVAIQARTDLDGARISALKAAGVVPTGFDWSTFDEAYPYDWLSDDFDWYYH